MALGQVLGRENMEDTQAYRDAMKPANEICDNFVSRLEEVFKFSEPLQSTICRDIQRSIYGRGFDLNNEEDYQAFLEHGGHSDTGCPLVCSVAAEVSAEKLNEFIKINYFNKPASRR